MPLVRVELFERRLTPERVLAAIKAKREPERDGKRVLFDQHLSVKSVSSNGGSGFLGVDA